ncbi:MAG: hypothetical protein ACJAVL_001335 [Bacteroidia bacterium]|jgi:hypothetical protein
MLTRVSEEKKTRNFMKNQKFPAWWSQPNKCRSTGSLFELFKPYTQRYRNSTVFIRELKPGIRKTKYYDRAALYLHVKLGESNYWKR